MQQLLLSRDARAARQRQWLEAFPGQTLLCLTVQPPGPEKRTHESLVIGEAGLEALKELFGSRVKQWEAWDLETGYEAFLLVDYPPQASKRTAVQLEQTHPLGRLMDVDVLWGFPPQAVGREQLGLPPRQCLLCPREVRFCMRAGTHTKEELLQRIRTMVKNYERDHAIQKD